MEGKKRTRKQSPAKHSGEKRAARQKDAKGILVALCAVFLLAIAIIVIILTNYEAPINGDYFVSDNTKLVASMDREISVYEDSEYEPVITHIVYYIGGEKIKNIRFYYQYSNSDDAKAAFDEISIDDIATSKKLSGKYIVLESKKELYEDLTTEEIRSQIETMQAAGILLDHDEIQSVVDAGASFDRGVVSIPLEPGADLETEDPGDDLELEDSSDEDELEIEE